MSATTAVSTVIRMAPARYMNAVVRGLSDPR